MGLCLTHKDLRKFAHRTSTGQMTLTKDKQIKFLEFIPNFLDLFFASILFFLEKFSARRTSRQRILVDWKLDAFVVPRSAAVARSFPLCRWEFSDQLFEELPVAERPIAGFFAPASIPWVQIRAFYHSSRSNLDVWIEEVADWIRLDCVLRSGVVAYFGVGEVSLFEQPREPHDCPVENAAQFIF